MSWENAGYAVLGALGGMASLLLAIVSIRKLRPDIAKTIIDSAREVVDISNKQRETMQADLDKIKAELKIFKRENKVLDKEIARLRNKLERMKQVVLILSFHIQKNGLSIPIPDLSELLNNDETDGIDMNKYIG